MSEDGQDDGGGDGSADASSNPGGLGSHSASADNKPTTTDTIDWRTAITDDEIRNSPTIQQIKAENTTEALDSISKQLINAQKMVGTDKIPKLKEDATPEQRRAYLNEYFNIPAEKDVYEFDLGEEPTDDAKEVAALFQEMSFENELSKEAANDIYNKLGEFFEQKGQAAQDAQAAQISENLGKLRDEWGDRYEGLLKQANVAAERVGGDDLLKFFDDNPQFGNDPTIIKAFQKMAVMMMEDAPAGTNSNFSKGVNSSENITAFENSAEWKNALNKQLSGEATPQENAEYQRLLEQRTLLWNS